MRQPKQILAFPYKKNNNGEYIYAIFCRSNKNEVWQGIAGGVEENESILEACKREANEEAGISYSAPIIKLLSMSTMPVVNVTKDFIWGENTYLIEEYCFGIDASKENLVISHEHSKMEWLTYEEAKNKLKWDSNKNALWELNWKLYNDNEKI